MREITIQEFIECYRPICNDCTPFPTNFLKEQLGNVIWDKRDYSRIASHLRNRTIWTIFYNTTEDNYEVVATIEQNMSSRLVGYIVTEAPYSANDVALLRFFVNNKGED